MITIDAIKQATCEKFGIPIDMMESASRSRVYAVPRMIAMYLSRDITSLSLPEIGRHFNRDHTTVYDAWDKFRERALTDPYLSRAMREIRYSLGAEGGEPPPPPGKPVKDESYEDRMRQSWRASAQLTRVSGSAF